MLTFERDSDPLVSAPAIAGWKRSTWVMWFCLAFLLNTDKGIFPLALRDADFTSMAWQSAIPYALGAACGLCMAAWMFHTASAKCVISACLLMDAVAFGILSTNPLLRVFAVLRACNGFIAVVVLLYLPLWVEEFAPSTLQSRWMVLFAFLAPALGVLAGFLVTLQLELQHTALIIAGCLVLCAFKLFVSSTLALQVPTLEKVGFNIPRLDSLSSPAVQIRSWWYEEPGSSKAVCILLGLVHGAGAPLLLYAPKVFGYGALNCSIIALCPFLGAPVGAYVCNKHGGYKPGYSCRALRTLSIILVLCLVSTVLLLVSTFIDILKPIALGYVLLFLGAALPPAAGVLMTGSPSYHRPASSFFSTLLYQILSYAAAPGILCLIAPLMDDGHGAYAITAQMAITLTIAVVLAVYSYERFPKVAVPMGLSTIDVQKEEIEIEVSRRRLLVSL